MGWNSFSMPNQPPYQIPNQLFVWEMNLGFHCGIDCCVHGRSATCHKKIQSNPKHGLPHWFALPNKSANTSQCPISQHCQTHCPIPGNCIWNFIAEAAMSQSQVHLPWPEQSHNASSICNGSVEHRFVSCSDVLSCCLWGHVVLWCGRRLFYCAVAVSICTGLCCLALQTQCCAVMRWRIDCTQHMWIVFSRVALCCALLMCCTFWLATQLFCIALCCNVVSSCDVV